MALCPFAVKKLIPPGPNDPKIKARLAILHIAVSEADSLYDYFKDRSGGVESHFYIRRNGVIEQYRDTDYEADANTEANPFAISIETQGMGEGEWTGAQLASIKKLLDWINANHDVPYEVPTTWDGKGIGYHILFMKEWAGGARSCPGPDRIKQFDEVLVPWFATQVSSPHTTNPPASAIPDIPVVPKPKPKPAAVPKRAPRSIGLTRRGSTGALVRIIQRIVGAVPDGIYGPLTEAKVIRFQQVRGLAPDGVVGPNTGRALLMANGLLYKTESNSTVFLVQYIGGVNTDGIFGDVTHRAVREMQSWARITVDGVVGPVTASKIVR
jgi:peptidoglycan hydrolase-like protein with peptidoglycan-binding domain